MFRRYLLETSQIAGGFYSRKALRQLIRVVVEMMLSHQDPYGASPPETHHPDNICRRLAHDPPDRIPSKSYAKRRCHSFNTDQGDRAVNTKLFQKLRRVNGLIAFASILIGCGLPSTGPNKQQVYSGGQASNVRPGSYPSLQS